MPSHPSRTHNRSDRTRVRPMASRDVTRVRAVGTRLQGRKAPVVAPRRPTDAPAARHE